MKKRLRPMAKVTQGLIPCPSWPAFFPLLHSVFQKLETNSEENKIGIKDGQEHGSRMKILLFREGIECPLLLSSYYSQR